MSESEHRTEPADSGPDTSDSTAPYDPDEDQDTGATNTAPPGERPSEQSPAD
jgi:hypothetical protein